MPAVTNVVRASLCALGEWFMLHAWVTLPCSATSCGSLGPKQCYGAAHCTGYCTYMITALCGRPQLRCEGCCLTVRWARRKASPEIFIPCLTVSWIEALLGLLLLGACDDHGPRVMLYLIFNMRPAVGEAQLGQSVLHGAGPPLRNDPCASQGLKGGPRCIDSKHARHDSATQPHIPFLKTRHYRLLQSPR